MYWVFSVLLLFLGLGLAVMEVFVPSAGILGFLATASLIGAIVVAFQQGPGFGLGILVTAGIGLPAALVLAFRYWPYTPIGRKVMLQAPDAEDVLPYEDIRQRLKGLIGKIGRAKCIMLPGGAVTVEGETFDAVSEGVPIEAGQTVRVVQVRGTRLVVRPTDEDEPLVEAEDPLRRPIESVTPDPFEEPLA
ncbi:MAG: NfeD family protein [Planctomycetota bacterium]